METRPSLDGWLAALFLLVAAGALTVGLVWLVFGDLADRGAAYRIAAPVIYLGGACSLAGSAFLLAFDEHRARGAARFGSITLGLNAAFVGLNIIGAL